MSKFIVFDFDGTIVSSMDLGLKLFNQIADKYNIRKLKKEEIHHFSRLSMKERIKRFEVPLYLIPKLIFEFKREYRLHVHSLREINGMKEEILKLKQKGYPLGIISSNSVANIREFLVHRDLDVFDYVYSSRGIFGKSSTISTVSKKLKIKKENMIYVGDELRDIDSCHKAGVQIIAVTWGFDPLELLLEGKPDYIAKKPDQLLPIFEGIIE